MNKVIKYINFPLTNAGLCELSDFVQTIRKSDVINIESLPSTGHSSFATMRLWFWGCK